MNGDEEPRMWSAPTAWAAEGERVGIVTCLLCGAAVMLSMNTDSLVLHSDWHARMEQAS